MASLYLVAIVELDILLADAAVERQTCIGRSQPRRPRLLEPSVQEKDLVEEAEQCETECETDEGDEDPVVAKPEDDLDVGPVPAVTQVVSEETPRVVVVLVREEDA